MWVIHRGLLLRLPWRTWVCPSQNQWFLGQQEIWCSRRTWQPTPLFFPGGSLGQRSPQAMIHRVPKSWTWAKQLHTYSCRIFFFFLSSGNSVPVGIMHGGGMVAWIKGTLAISAVHEFQQLLSQEIRWRRRYGYTEDMVIGLFLACDSSAPVGLSVKVQLLGVQGLQQHQGCRDTNCLSHRSNGPNRIFF